LKVLEVSGIDNDVEAMYEALSGSTALRRVKFTELPVSSAALRQLGTCPNIETLVFRWAIVKDKTKTEDLRALISLKHLRDLAVSTLDYSEDLVTTLSQFKSLRYLFFNFSGNWSEEQLMKVRRAVPYANVDALRISDPPVEHKYPPLLKGSESSP